MNSSEHRADAAKLPHPDATGTLRGLVGASELVAVETVHFHARRAEHTVGKALPPIDVASVRVEPTFDTLKPVHPPPGSATFLVRGNIKFQPNGDNSDAVAEIQIVLRLTYNFAGQTAALPDDSLQQFANQIALHHAWPFLRERVATACQILGVQGYVLPLRKLVG